LIDGAVVAISGAHRSQGDSVLVTGAFEDGGGAGHDLVASAASTASAAGR